LIKKIQQTAEEVREVVVMKCRYRYINEIVIKLQQLTKQLKETRHENDFNEIVLNQLEQIFK
jgi:hypothetical protein